MNGKFGRILVLAVAFFLAVVFTTAHAKRSYLNSVNETCTESWDCGICHTDPEGGGPLTQEGIDYVDSGYDDCIFCPDASPCTGGCTDADSDGYFAEGGECGPADCNDSDAGMNPGAAEICDDAKDNDCDGAIDSLDSDCGTPPACTDNDGDGYFAEGGDCGKADCNDTDPDIHPGACDTLNDGIDQDCSRGDRTKGKPCPGDDPEPDPEGKGRTCADGTDNDGDTLVDCDDPDCSTSKKCR